MGGTGGGLAQLLLMLAAGRRQAILGRRDAREELAAKRDERDQRERAFQFQVDQAKAEQERQQKQDAYQRAQMFGSILFDPDKLLEAQRNGMLPGILAGAKETFGAAGLPFDVSGIAGRAGLREQKTPSYIEGPGVSVNPSAVPEFLRGILPEAVPQASQFVPMPPTVTRTPQPDLSVPAPARIEMRGQSVNPAVGGMGPFQPGSFGSLLPPVTPAGPVSVPRPDLVTETPAGKPLQPSLKTERDLAEATSKQSEREARIRKLATDEAFIREKITDQRVTREPRVLLAVAKARQAEAAGDLTTAQLYWTEARTATEEALRQPKVALTEAGAANVANMPSSRAAGRAVTERGQNITAQTARRGQDIRREVGLANVEVAKQRAQQAAKKSTLNPLKQQSFRKWSEIWSAKIPDPLGGEPQWKYDAGQRQQAFRAMQGLAQEGGFSLSDVLGGGGAPGGDTAVTGGLMNDLQNQGASAAPKRKLAPKDIKGQSTGALLRRLSELGGQ